MAFDRGNIVYPAIRHIEVHCAAFLVRKRNRDGGGGGGGGGGGNLLAYLFCPISRFHCASQNPEIECQSCNCTRHLHNFSISA